MKLRPSILLASISALVTTTATVSAVDFIWNSGTGDWATASNWNTNSVPGGGGGNFAIVNNGGSVDINASTNSIQDTILGRGAGNSGTVNLNAGTHTNTGWTIVGDAGTGTFNQTGGSQVTGDMLIGIAGGTGSYTVSGTGSATLSRFGIGGHRDVGTGGTGSMTVNTTGTITANSDLWVGTRGANATLNVQAGTVNANTWMMVGETHQGGASTGVVNQTGGVVSNAVTNGAGRFWVGSQEGGATAASTGTYNLSGGTLNARNAAIGRHYTGIFHHSGGTANFTQADDETTLATFAGSTANYNLSGTGQVNFNGTAQIGTRGNATFNQTGGTVSSNGWLGIGRFAGGVGTVNVSAGTFTHNGNGTSMIIGEEGTGTLTVSGTGRVTENSTNGLRIAHGTGGNGTINLNAGGELETHFIQKTNAGATAKVNFDGGTLRALSPSANPFVGLSDAELEVKAGGLIFDSNGHAVTITHNLAGAGGLTKVGNGTLSITGAPSYAGTTTVNGGKLSRGNGGTTGSIPGAVSVGAAGTFAINRSDDLTNTNTVSGAGSFAKDGTNTVTIGSELNALTGSVQVNGGRLINTAATDIAGASLSVNSGATLLPLGGAVGAINTTGVTVGTGSTLNFDFSAGGATHDQIISTGGVTFTGAYTVNLFDVGTANAFSTNGTYSLFDYATTVTGSPSGFTIGNAVVGKSYQLANNSGDTTLRMTIADAVLVQWNQVGGGLWSTNTNWTPNITPNVATADVNFAGSITGASTVDIDGNKTSGKLTFDNANSYTVAGTGTLTLDNGLAAGSIAVVTGNHFINTPLALPNASGVSTATGTVLQLGDVSGAGTITKSGNGTLVLNGTTASSGGLIVNGGLVQAGTGGAGGALPTGNISLAAGTRVSLNSTAASTIAGNITGQGSVSQDAAGTITHTGTSNYTGFTDLNAGTFNNNGSITGTSNIDVNNTTNLGAGSTTTTPGNIIVGAGGTLTSAGTASFNKLAANDGASGTINGGTVSATEGLFAGESGTGTLNINGGTTTALRIWSGTGGGAVGNINISAGRVDANQWTVIGSAGGSTGTLTQTGGTLNQNHTDFLTVGENGSGTYTMSGASVLNDQAVVDTSARGTNKGNIIIGRNAGSVGVWTLNDSATARIRELLVGNAATSTGTVNINGTSSVTSSYDLHIGNAGTGTVNVNGGSLTTVTGWTQIGMGGGSNGTLNVAAGTVYNREMRVGIDGTGTLDVSGGTVTANQVISLGVNASGNGTLTARGTATLTVDNGGISAGAANPNVAGTGTGTFNIQDTAVVNILNNGGLRVGGVGTGTYNQSGGTVNVSGTAIFGNGGTIAANANVTGGSLAVNGELWVGQAAGGNATMNISGGTVSSNNWIAVGRQTGVGTVNISGTGTLVKNGGGGGSHIIVGAGQGTIAQTGGTFEVTPGNGEIRLGETAGGSGLWNISGGSGSADAISVGAMTGGSGAITMNGGTITTGNLRIGDAGPGVVTQNDGTMTVSGNLDVQGGASGSYALIGGRLNANGTVDTSNGTFIFGAGVISRTSAGLIDINGPLTTANSGATLKLDNDKTFDISGAFDNTTGLTLDLAGMGIPDGTFTGSPLTGSFSLGVIGGAITLAGDAFDIANTSLLGFDSVFDIGFGSMTASRINEDAPFNPNADSVFWVDEDAGIVTVQYNVVPEPTSIVLMLGGLALLARRRRRE